jgi:hypothetical protein
MKLAIDLSGARMFGRRLAFALARRRATGRRVQPPRTITVPRPRGDSLVPTRSTHA